MSDATPSRPSADRNLLFGILALQMDFISRDALIAAMNAWVLDKAKSLGEILVNQQALRPDQHAALDVLVGMHLECHEDDAEKSLAAISVPALLHRELRSLGDNDVDASLARVPTPPRDASVLPSTTAEKPGRLGLRYQVLRQHGKGGIGEVFVARDQELNREIALKEIRQEHADDPHSRGRFVREAEITGGLEHPGIVPVYGLGQYGDGRPFYAMRFIQGETLKDAIARYHQASPVASAPGELGASAPEALGALTPSRSPEFELRALVTRFVAVCNTIAYAHNRGVIHRDIKPANIMLGKYGETLIVDWGLAKALSDSPARSASDGLPEPALVPRLAEIGETQTGAALGTPAYMSPEQAAGRVDLLAPASDIYSLGATLYTLLTGRPPIESKESVEILRKAQRGEWLPARQVKSDVPPALEAICGKAMAMKPEQRYATALELAADVEHWLADEPMAAYAEPWPVRARRWLRRHQTLATATAAAVVVAAVSLAVAAALLVAANNRERLAREAEEQTADRERQARKWAETNFRLARQAVDGLSRISESPELKALAMEPLRRDLLGQAKDFYNQLASQQADEPSLQAERGRAYVRLAEITEQLGDRPGAIALALQAQDIFEGLYASDPGNADYQDDLARALTTAGRNHYEMDKYQAAKPALERATAIREQLRAANPSERHHRFKLAVALNHLGLLYQRMGKPAEAAATHEKARSLCQQLMDESPKEADYQSELARTLTALGSMADLDQNYARQAPLAGQATDLLERLVKDHPKRADYQSRLAQALTSLSLSHANLRQPEQAKEIAERALAVANNLVGAHPDVPEYLKQLGNARVNYAIALAQLGEHSRAATEVESAVAKAGFLWAPYNGACAYCLCSVAAVRDGNLPNAERDKVAAKYLDRAMSLLHEAEKKGLFKQAQGVSGLQNDHDLDPLRQREDFKKLLARVQEPGGAVGQK
jgi:serine/threonine-protein kinase